MRKPRTEEHKRKISESLKKRNAGRTEKLCPRCGKTQPLAAFGPRDAVSGFVNSYCVPCARTYSSARQKKYIAAHPELKEKLAATNRKTTLRLKYGLTEEQFQAMLEEQGGRCAICDTDNPSTKRKQNFCVDHDHETGKVRGLLCDRCNRAIGLLADCPGILASAAEYMARHKPKQAANDNRKARRAV